MLYGVGDVSPHPDDDVPEAGALGESDLLHRYTVTACPSAPVGGEVCRRQQLAGVIQEGFRVAETIRATP